MTHSVAIYLASERAVRAGIPMTPRSANDKEYFPQDWFADRLNTLQLRFVQNGRNSYPDFWVENEGYEVKCLRFARGKPARKDYDSNSTVPSGRNQDKDVFMVFFLYTGSGASDRYVTSLVIAHGDLINANHDIAGEHVNSGIAGFGSYADGHIRNRKMYRFPTPYSLVPSCIGRCRLITPAAWKIEDPKLVNVDTIDRTLAPMQVRSFEIDLQDQANPRIRSDPHPNAGQVLRFDVWEAQGSTHR